MHCQFFVKHLFFCVMVLSIGIHATSSIAESSNRLPKTTSVLSLFVKAVVMGLAFGSQIQVLASPSPKKQTPSLNKRQEQQGSNVCVSNSDDIFYVGQNNLTHCLEQHPRGTFIFVERVNFTQFSENEKNKYPLYNETVPFSGSLTMFPYSFDNFSITRSVFATLFVKIENATIRANLTHPDIKGNLFSSLITYMASKKITIKLELDSASVTVFNGFGLAAGVVICCEESDLNLSVRGKNYLNVEGTTQVGGFIGSTGISTIDINAIIDTLTVKQHFGSLGGVIGSIDSEARIKVNLKGSLINLMTPTFRQ